MKQIKGNKEEIYQAIYEVVRSIPPGRVTSYGAIAAAVGMPNGARIVGYAMGKAGDATPVVPAHRVVNSAGVLSGRHQFQKPGQMQQLLEKEGVKVANNKVVNFTSVLWDPLREL